MNPILILNHKYYAIVKPSNLCEICGKSRNYQVHEKCSKEKQKKYGEKK